MLARRYCLVTPCRDEALHARRTLDAVARQTVPPALWVIVDDGSRDSTPAILAEYADRLPYLRVVRRADRGDRKLGGGVIEAFYAGYETTDPGAFDYVCKLDLDLDLPPRYFERLMERMEADPRIGTCSGKPYYAPPGRSDRVPLPLTSTGGLVAERCSDEHSVGMTKFFRGQCFREIGGFVRELMWDGIDGHRCRQLGWKSVSWDEPELRFLHLRPMGTSHRNWWTGRVRHGRGQWYMGTAPLYLLASALSRLFHPPVLLGALAMVVGYFGAMLKGMPRHGDAEFRRFVRRYQRTCLLRGKARATAALDARQASRWAADHPPPPPALSGGPSHAA
jgi:hypothetical protein